MRIGIHYKGSFAKRWISYCDKFEIPYKKIDCYGNDIINQTADCDIIMWHHAHFNIDPLLAKPLLFNFENEGKIVFPDYKTNWHFDDKIAQKYLFESLNIPHIPTHIFYEKENAMEWLRNTNFPIVFKLRSGAGASNVKLVNSSSEARKLIKKAFNKGFKKIDQKSLLIEKFKKLRSGKVKSVEFIKYFMKDFLVAKTTYERERGYVYFQDFIPNNKSDIRIIVIGDRAFAIERFVRKNDFRASGSGSISYLDEKSINKELLRIAFDSTKKIGAQCLAFDFVYLMDVPLVVEISYGFSMLAYDNCLGYWNADLNWVSGKFNPQEWILDDLINSSKLKTN